MFKRVVCLLIGALLVAAFTASAQHVIISEVAWAGTQASSTDEWIELYNASDRPVDLSGWRLALGSREVALGEAANPVLPPGAYFLLERTDDTAVSDIEADLVYAGALSNTGTVLRLLDSDGNEVDTANAGTDGGWCGGATGSGVPAYGSMERIDPSAADSPSNWRTNDGVHRTGYDAEENPINGTPKAKNSATVVWRTVPKVLLASTFEEGATIDGTLLLSWTASDPDGPSAALHAAVYVSANGGEDWEPLVERLVGSAYACDTTGLAPGDAYCLRVTVTDADGNTGAATTPVFRIAQAD
jgi:hypothetical protein